MTFLKILNKIESVTKEFDEKVLVAAEKKCFGEPVDDIFDRLYDKTGKLIAEWRRNAKKEN
jgi:hypothetical protein